jgi:putative chitinase
MVYNQVLNIQLGYSMSEKINYLKKYQQDLGVEPDGKIGPNTAKAIMADLGITDKLLFAHAMGQAMHESGVWTNFRENMNYDAPGLLNIFRDYYKPFPGLAEKHARKPEAIGNHVYANRNGNGNEASGDGYFYRGAFGLQTTGKANFLELFEFCGLPADTNPDDLTDNYKAYFQSIFFWFKKNDAEKLCCGTSDEDITDVGKKVNRGNAKKTTKPAHHNDERIAYTRLMFKAVGLA